MAQDSFSSRDADSAATAGGVPAGTRSSQTTDPALARAEEELARTRERVAQSMLALRNEVVRRTDWRRVVREHPLLSAAAAFALGLWWGSRRGARAARRGP